MPNQLKCHAAPKVAATAASSRTGADSAPTTPASAESPPSAVLIAPTPMPIVTSAGPIAAAAAATMTPVRSSAGLFCARSATALRIVSTPAMALAAAFLRSNACTIESPMSITVSATLSLSVDHNPASVVDCASIRPLNLPPSSVRWAMAACIWGKPTAPSSTRAFTSSVATPIVSASASIMGMPRLVNWFRSAVYMRPCTIVVPYR